MKAARLVLVAVLALLAMVCGMVRAQNMQVTVSWT